MCGGALLLPRRALLACRLPLHLALSLFTTCTPPRSPSPIPHPHSSHTNPFERAAAQALQHPWVQAGLREQTQLLNLGRVQAALRKYVDDRDLPPRTFTNQVIIQQGGRNPFLYMIMKGTVEVIVAGTTPANADNECAGGRLSCPPPPTCQCCVFTARRDAPGADAPSSAHGQPPPADPRSHPTSPRNPSPIPPPQKNRLAVGFCIEGQYLGEFLLFTPEELMGSFPPDETDCLQLVQTRGGAQTVEFSPIRVHAVGTVVVQLVEADEIMRLFGYDEAAVRAILGEARLRYRKIMDCHAALAGSGAEGAAVGPHSIVADVPDAADSQRAVPQQMTLPGALGTGSSGHGHAQHAQGGALPSARLASIASASVVLGPPAGAPLPPSGKKTAPAVISDFFGSSRPSGASGVAGSQRPQGP